MAHDHKHIDIENLPNYKMSHKLKTTLWALMFIGVITFALGLAQNTERIWHSYMTSFFYFASLSLGGAFFLSINFVTNAAWFTTIRRIPEAFTRFLPYALGAFLIMLLGMNHLFDWVKPEALNDPIIQAKKAYLNIPFFIIRTIAFFALWIYFANKMVKNSLDQDKDGDTKFTFSNHKLSVGFLVVFALSYSLFGVDMMMSMDPHWFSTMFGVYCFAGLFQSFLAMTVLFMNYLVKNGVLKEYVNENHLHDVGKYLFGFTVFYAYIGFSQFMLIWYANLPEETLYFLHRSHGNWFYVSLSLLFLKFIVPFLALAPRWAKRDFKWISMVSILILVMQYVDIYWMVYPSYNNETAVFSFWEIGVFLGFLGAFLFAAHRFLESNNIIPKKDPRLQKSLDHHI